MAESIHHLFTIRDRQLNESNKIKSTSKTLTLEKCYNSIRCNNITLSVYDTDLVCNLRHKREVLFQRIKKPVTGIKVSVTVKSK